MIHFFNTTIAKQYGIPSAVVLQNIAYWVKRNEYNETNFHEGKYWTYNSKKAWADEYDYLSSKQIERILDKLREEQLIETGCFNKATFDRTLWYTLTPKGWDVLGDTFTNREFDYPKSGNGTPEIGQPIPNNIPNKKKKKEQTPSEYNIILKDDTEYNIPLEDIEFYRKSYPNVDVDANLRSMVAWCYSNPSNRKTRRGITKFINGWLDRDSKEKGNSDKDAPPKPATVWF